MNPRQFQRTARGEEGRDRDLERRVRALESKRASEIPVDAIGTGPETTVQAALASLVVIVGSGGLVDAADDAAAAAAGVAVGSFYRTGSAVKVRIA